MTYFSLCWCLLHLLLLHHWFVTQTHFYDESVCPSFTVCHNDWKSINTVSSSSFLFAGVSSIMATSQWCRETHAHTLTHSHIHTQISYNRFRRPISFHNLLNKSNLSCTACVSYLPLISHHGMLTLVSVSSHELFQYFRGVGRSLVLSKILKNCQ